MFRPLCPGNEGLGDETTAELASGWHVTMPQDGTAVGTMAIVDGPTETSLTFGSAPAVRCLVPPFPTSWLCAPVSLM